MPEQVADIPLLSVLLGLPVIGIAFIVLRLLSARDDEMEGAGKAAKWVALATTSFTFVFSVYVFFQFDPLLAGYQLVEEVQWFGGCLPGLATPIGDAAIAADCDALGIKYKLGVDGISMPFVLLTTFFMPIVILAGWNSISTRVGEYMIAFLALEVVVIGVFTALDLVLFYVFFEASLVPMFLIIGVWGSRGDRTVFGRHVSNRVYAAFKFFLYTFFGSLFMLVAILWIYLMTGTADVVALQGMDFAENAQRWLWMAFFASFAVKLPMWPVHTWLPDAHVQAPTGGSIVLAAILLKMGGYGFVRFSLPMFPDASVAFAPFVFVLSVLAILYTSLVAFAQEDMKKLIAYSSVAHMGFVTLGLFSGTTQGIDGAIFQMISHGFISGALFLGVGIVYDRFHTREIAAYGGLVKPMKWFAFFFLLFSMANIGLPGLSGFVGEMLTLVGAFQANSWAAGLAVLGIVLAAAYGLRLYREVMFGTLNNKVLETGRDLDRRELGLMTVLAGMTLYFGVNPTPTLHLFRPATSFVEMRLDAGADEAREVAVTKIDQGAATGRGNR